MRSTLKGMIMRVAVAAHRDSGDSGAKGYPLALPLSNGGTSYCYRSE